MTDPDFEDLVRDYNLISITLDEYPQVEQALRLAFIRGATVGQYRTIRAQAQAAAEALRRTILHPIDDLLRITMHKPHLPEPTSVHLENTHTRKENAGEDNRNATDLKCVITLQQGDLHTLFSNPDELQAALWDDEGEPRDEDLSALTYGAEIDDQVVTVKASKWQRPRTFSPARVKVKNAQPDFGGLLKVTLTVSVYPDVSDIGLLHDAEREIVKLTIQDQQARVTPIQPSAA